MGSQRFKEQIFVQQMNNYTHLDQNQKLLVEAFKLQNQQAYDQAIEKLQSAGQNLIKIIEKIQSSSEFYMRYMQLMKEQRDLVSQKDYKQFLSKNEKVLSKNFQKNAYMALLMKEIEEKQSETPVKKLSSKQVDDMKKLIDQGNHSFQDIEKKFPKQSKQELKKKYDSIVNKTKNVKKQESMSVQYD